MAAFTQNTTKGWTMLAFYRTLWMCLSGACHHGRCSSGSKCRFAHLPSTGELSTLFSLSSLRLFLMNSCRTWRVTIRRWVPFLLFLHQPESTLQNVLPYIASRVNRVQRLLCVCDAFFQTPKSSIQPHRVHSESRGCILRRPDHRSGQ